MACVSDIEDADELASDPARIIDLCRIAISMGAPLGPVVDHLVAIMDMVDWRRLPAAARLDAAAVRLQSDLYGSLGGRRRDLASIAGLRLHQTLEGVRASARTAFRASARGLDPIEAKCSAPPRGGGMLRLVPPDRDHES